VTSTTAPTTSNPIDMHVHIVGNGTGGTGCWMQVRGIHRLAASFMVRHLGLPQSALKGDLDALYAEQLRRMVQASSLKAVVILAHEEVYDDYGRRLEGAGSFHVPNDHVLNLARRYAEFLPAVSIHPARRDALEELDRCVAEGAVMMKCLPNCQNIDCNDRRYTRFWERMAEHGLPLLAHTGGEFSLPVVRRELSDPRTLERPLQCGVTVIAAHCGTSCGWLDQDYFPVFVEMTRRHPRLFGDISALNQLHRSRHLLDCLRLVGERMVHGSDFPIPALGHAAWFRGWLGWSVFRKWQRHWNVLERDYQFKRAVGFPSEVFGRVTGILRPGPWPALGAACATKSQPPATHSPSPTRPIAAREPERLPNRCRKEPQNPNP
jgi:predicted TIM-barrel fold metal-dependent hydrolase